MDYITQEKAKSIDEYLFQHYDLAQLMELAGLSCAMAIDSVVSKHREFLVICGPGNNGGDGLVCARHLRMMGHKVTVYCPKTKFQNLWKQCELVGVEMFRGTHYSLENALMLCRGNPRHFDYVVDAIFGFGFRGGTLDECWSSLFQTMRLTPIRIISIDVPSGSNVNDENLAWSPHMIISLTLPKVCTKNYGGNHYLGGPFLSKDVLEKFGLQNVKYGTSYMFQQIKKD